MSAQPGEGRAYHLSERPGAPPRDIFVGWDAHHGSYFAQVTGYGDWGEGIENVDVFSAGYPSARRPAEITDPHQIVQMIERYAVIPDDLLDRLVVDRTRPAEPVTPDPAADVVVPEGHLLPRRPDVSDCVFTYVGWDSRHGSYFARVITYTDPFDFGERGTVDLLPAGYPAEVVTDPDQILRAVEHYAIVPGDLRDQLVADRVDSLNTDEGFDILAGRVVIDLAAGSLDADSLSPDLPAAATGPAAAAAFQSLHQVHTGAAAGNQSSPPSAHRASHRARSPRPNPFDPRTTDDRRPDALGPAMTGRRPLRQHYQDPAGSPDRDDDRAAGTGLPHRPKAGRLRAAGVLVAHLRAAPMTRPDSLRSNR